MVDARQFILDLLARTTWVRQVPKSSDAGPVAPVQRHFVDGRGALAAIHRRCVVPRRVHVRPVVRRQVQTLDCPRLAVGEVFGRNPAKGLARASKVSWWF